MLWCHPYSESSQGISSPLLYIHLMCHGPNSIFHNMFDVAINMKACYLLDLDVHHFISTTLQSTEETVGIKKLHALFTCPWLF